MFEKGYYICEVFAPCTNFSWLACKEGTFSHEIITPELLDESMGLFMNQYDIAFLDVE